jgi:hypothetical protein
MLQLSPKKRFFPSQLVVPREGSIQTLMIMLSDVSYGRPKGKTATPDEYTRDLQIAGGN